MEKMDIGSGRKAVREVRKVECAPYAGPKDTKPLPRSIAERGIRYAGTVQEEKPKLVNYSNLTDSVLVPNAELDYGRVYPYPNPYRRESIEKGENQAYDVQRGMRITKTVRFFVAGSTKNESKVKEWKDELSMFFHKMNHTLNQRGVSLHWDSADTASDNIRPGGKQGEIDEQILQSDFFYVLVDDAAGKITEKEFDLAYHHLGDKGKPVVFVYFHSPEDEDWYTPFSRRARPSHDDGRPSSCSYSGFYSAIDILYATASSLRHTVSSFFDIPDNSNDSEVSINVDADADEVGAFHDKSGVDSPTYLEIDADLILQTLEESSDWMTKADGSLDYLCDYIQNNQNIEETGIEDIVYRRRSIRFPRYYARPTRNVDSSVQAFKNKIRSLANYESGCFVDIDTVKLSMLTALEQLLIDVPVVNSDTSAEKQDTSTESKVNNPLVQFRGGIVVLNGEKLESDALNLMNVPLYRKFPGCERLAEKAADSKKTGQNVIAVEKEWNDLEDKIKDLCLMVYIAKRQPELVSPRTRKAIRAIEAGRYREAEKQLGVESDSLEKASCRSEEGRYTLELYDLIRKAVDENAKVVRKEYGIADTARQKQEYSPEQSRMKRVFFITAIALVIIVFFMSGAYISVLAGLDVEFQTWAFLTAALILAALLFIIAGLVYLRSVFRKLFHR